MGEIADDAFDSAIRRQAEIDLATQEGAKPCPHCSKPDYIHADECPICHDLGWIDRDGNPCEV